MLCWGSDFQTVLFAFDTQAAVSCDLFKYRWVLSGTQPESKGDLAERTAFQVVKNLKATWGGAEKLP